MGPDDGLRRLVRIALSGVAPLVLAACVVLLDLVGVSNTGADLHDLFLTTALCGASSMALIETVKRLSAVRAAFQLRLVRAELLRLGMARAVELPSFRAAELDRRGLEQQVALLRSESLALADYLRNVIADQVLVPLGLGRIDSAFNLPVEQLMPQLADVLALVRLDQGSERWVPRGWFDDRNPIGPRLVDVMFRPLGLPRDSVRPGVDSHSVYVNDDSDQGRITDRITSRFLEQLQIRVGNRWRHYVRATAAWVAGALGLAIAYWGPGDVLVSRATPIAALAVGGFLAWLARDLTAAVERWRR